MKPPSKALAFLRWFCREDYLEEIEGDLTEIFKQQGATAKARRHFTWGVIKHFRPEFFKPFKYPLYRNPGDMQRSYIKIGWRNLRRNKTYSLINIGGLSAGLTITILIGLWVHDELSFNHYHTNYSQIAQVYRRETRGDQTFATTYLTTGLSTLLKTEYGSHFERIVTMSSRLQQSVLSNGTQKLTQGGFLMEPGGVAMFNLKLKSGTGTGLTDNNAILLSESSAKALFGNDDPVNKTVSMDASADFKVAGVYEDLPFNSEFHDASFFAPIERFVPMNVWDNYNVRIYVMLPQETGAAATSALIRNSTKTHIPLDRKQEIFLHPMSQWHLNSEFKDGNQVTSNKMLAVRYYALIGVFVLLLACINFMNLSTARSEMRAKEVGIRKSIGSPRSQLIQQFYTESLMVTSLSFILAIVIAALCLPAFNSLSGKQIDLPWSQPLFWMAGLAFIVFTTLLAGSYPALFLSSFKPTEVLKGRRMGGLAIIPRKVLVVMQFAVSSALTVGTLVVFQQIQHAKDRPVGYTRENLISIRAASPEFRGKFETLRNELLSTGTVEEIAGANYSVIETLGWNDGFTWKERRYEPSFNTIVVTPEYGKTIGWQFLAGRDFSRDFETDVSCIVINESAQKLLAIPNPVGEILHYDNVGTNGQDFKIVGVVRDMVKGSPYTQTDPSIIFCSRADLPWLYMRLNPNSHLHDAVTKVGTTLAKIVPSAAFDFTFADEDYNAKFASEEKIENLATIFSTLAILISCLGLIGLAAFSAEQRKKEIGIRKIVGASVPGLWRMLCADYFMLAIAANVIALPLSSYLMNRWLIQFEYRTQISGWLLAGIGLGTVALTILTVSYQSIQAARANPVLCLRSE